MKAGRVYVLALTTIAFWLAAAEMALAHMALEKARPRPGQRLARSPDKISLTFSENVGDGSEIALFGQGFEKIAGVETNQNPEQPRLLEASVPALEPGTYTVQWRATATDGHTLSGSYAFEVTKGFSLVRYWPLALVLVALVAAGLARRSLR